MTVYVTFNWSPFCTVTFPDVKAAADQSVATRGVVALRLAGGDAAADEEPGNHAAAGDVEDGRGRIRDLGHIGVDRRCACIPCRPRVGVAAVQVVGVGRVLSPAVGAADLGIGVGLVIGRETDRIDQPHEPGRDLRAGMGEHQVQQQAAAFVGDEVGKFVVGDFLAAAPVLDRETALGAHVVARRLRGAHQFDASGLAHVQVVFHSDSP